MARTFEVYPKGGYRLSDDVWWLTVKVHDRDAGGGMVRFRYTLPGPGTLTHNLMLLKVVFWVVTGDLDTPQDVADALTVDDIDPHPVQTASVWSNWADLCTTKVVGLGGDPSVAEFKADWGPNDTNAVRSDARAALIAGRGWSVPMVYQVEGDGTELREVV